MPQEAVPLVGEAVVEGLPVEPGAVQHGADSVCLEHAVEDPLTLR